MNKCACYLGFDYGTKNIGVAIGQKITKSATVLTPLLSRKCIPPWKNIDKLIENWKPQALIVGVPYKKDGTSFNVTALAKNFIESLKNRYQLPVYPANELLTTKTARAVLFDTGGFKALKKRSVDSLAAKIILEEWINSFD